MSDRTEQNGASTEVISKTLIESGDDYLGSPSYPQIQPGLVALPVKTFRKVVNDIGEFTKQNNHTLQEARAAELWDIMDALENGVVGRVRADEYGDRGDA